MEDEIEGREPGGQEESQHMVNGLAECWANGRKGRYRNMETGKAEGNRYGKSRGRKGMAKGAQGQAIVDSKARTRTGRD